MVVDGYSAAWLEGGCNTLIATAVPLNADEAAALHAQQRISRQPRTVTGDVQFAVCSEACHRKHPSKLTVYRCVGPVVHPPVSLLVPRCKTSVRRASSLKIREVSRELSGFHDIPP